MRDYQDQDMMIRNRYRDRDRDSDRGRMDERGRGSAFFGSREPDRHEREHRGYRQESGWDGSDDHRDRDSGRGRRGSERRERDPEFGSDAYHKGIPMDETRHLIASNKVEGTPVYGRDGDRIGSIENFMVDKFKGEVVYAVLRSSSGFLGLGQRYHPLKWSELTYDRRMDGYSIDLTQDELDDRRSFDDRGREWGRGSDRDREYSRGDRGRW